MFGLAADSGTRELAIDSIYGEIQFRFLRSFSCTDWEEWLPGLWYH